MRVRQKLAALRASKVLMQGGLLAHQTGTLAGIAAHPNAIKKMQCFKQRKGPFLLLADSLRSAFKQARYITPTLRELAKQSWPGAVTLVVAGKPNLPNSCYQQGMMALRVDASEEARYLAKLCGGLLVSSSLNRRGKPVMSIERQQMCRYARWIKAYLPPIELYSEQKASQIYRLRGSKSQRLR